MSLVKARSYWRRVGPSSITGLYKMRSNTDTQGEDCVETEAETRVMQPPSKEHWSPQKLEEARKDPPLEPPESTALPTPCLRLLASGIMREYISVVKLPSLQSFVRAAPGH